jgi:hypothetical protein
LRSWCWWRAPTPSPPTPSRCEPVQKL